MRPSHLSLVLVLVAALVGGLWFALRAPAREGGVNSALTPLEAGAQDPDGALPGTEQALGPGSSKSMRAGVELAGNAEDAAAAEASEEEPPRVVGRAVDERGDPVADARVDLRKGEAWLALPADLEVVGGFGGTRRPRRAVTDAEGRFGFEEVEPGDYDFGVRAKGFAPLDRTRERVPVHERYDLGDLVLRRGITVEGRVVDGKGAGVAGVLVLRAASPEGGSLRLSVPGFGAPAATSDESGAFRVDTLAPGSWHLIFDSAAHRVVEMRGRLDVAGQVESGLVVRLEAGLPITGHVQGIDPVARPLRVVARASSEQPSGAGDAIEGAERDRPRHAEVQADGSFALLGLAPSIQYRLKLERESEPDLEAPADQVPDARFEVLQEVDSVLAMAGAREVVLERVAPTSVAYRMIDDESGAPITRAFASIQGEDLRGAGLLEDSSDEPRVEHPDGRVRHDDLRPAAAGSSATVHVNAEGYAPYEGASFLLRSGEERDLGDIRLERAPGVLVRVLDDESGEPIEGARVLIARANESDAIGRYLDPESEREPRNDARVRMALTDAEGRCRVTASAGEVCALRASSSAHLASEESRSLPPHGEAIELRLARAGSVVVRVVDPRAQPVRGVYVQHSGPEGASEQRMPWDTDARARQTSDEAGIVRFERLTAGRHRFEVPSSTADPFGQDEGKEPEAKEEVSVVEGAVSELELELSERGGFRAVLLEAGIPLPGALARLSEAGTDPRQRNSWGGPGVADPLTATSDHEGRIVFGGLPVGTYALAVSHPSRRMTYMSEVEVAANPDEERIELGLASIEGRVTGEQGEPLEGLNVSIASGTSGPDGGGMDFRLVVREEENGGTDFEMDEVGERRATTDRDGRFVLRGVRSDDELIVDIQGNFVVGESRRLPALARDEVRRGVDFSLRAAGQLEITLTGVPSGGRDRYNLLLACEAEGGARRNAQIRSWRPSTTVASLPPGLWKVEVRKANELVGTGETQVEAGVTGRLTIEVR